MKIIQLGCAQPKHYETGELGSDPILKDDQPVFDTYAQIVVSPDSSLLESIAECKAIWDVSAHDTTPAWIGHDAETFMLASVLNAEFGGNVEMRVIT